MLLYAIVIHHIEGLAMSSLAPVSVRMTANERDLLEAAAKNAHTNLSDFIRRKAIEAAELELLTNPRPVVIPAKDWEKFEEWIQSPPQDLPKLRKLLATKPVWED
jgi:uncharacterized protein (DUF1778 family)